MTTTHILAWCTACLQRGEPTHRRAESPTTQDRARVRAWAHRHANATGHEVHLEVGQIDIVLPKERP